MIEYWIAKNKERKGPLSPEALKDVDITPDTLVWRDGLGSWTKAGDLEELAWLFDEELPPEIPTSAEPPRFSYVAPVASYQNTTATCGATRPTLPPQPPTYIGWSIAALILCCMIPAIVALVMGSKVNSRYCCGDYEGAKRASESAELWLIVSIVAGLVWLPFSLVLQMMA